MEKVKVTATEKKHIDGFIEAHKRGLLPASLTVSLEKLADAIKYGYEVEPEYSKGDYVVWHGSVVNIKHPQTNDHKDDGRCYFTLERSDGSTYGNITRDEIRHATPSEITEEKERRKWAKIGRKVNEIKEHDIVTSKYGTKKLFEVVKVYDDKNIRIECENYVKNVFVDVVDLICPVESRLDVKTND